MATVTEKVKEAKEAAKETLVGVEQDQAPGQSQDDSQASAQTRASFHQHALKDDDGDLYLDQEQFVNAVAPVGEDYVRMTVSFLQFAHP